MTNSLKNRIARYVYNQGDWVNGGELERLAINWKNPKTGKYYKPSNVSRRCRELEEEGVFERREEGSVYYRCKELPRELKQVSEYNQSELRSLCQ